MPISSSRAQQRLWTVASRYATFVFAFLAFLIFAYFHRDLPFRGDAWEIWEISKHFYEPGRAHSFVEYRGPVTFVLFNAVYRVASAVGLGEQAGFRLFSAVVFALLTTRVVPALASRMFERRSTNAEVLLFVLATLYFFGGYLLHPQVDFLALTLFLAAVVLFLGPPSRFGPFLYAAAGLLLLSAVAMRMNYLVALPALLLMAYHSRVASGPGSRRRTLALAAFGIVAVVSSVLLLGQRADSGQSRVLKAQLAKGLTIEKIEWNAGDPRFPGGIIVADAAGSALVAPYRRQPDRLSMTPHEYLNLVARHPVAIGQIWLKHLFNGLDLWYDSVYVQDLYRGRLLRSLLNYTLFFLAILVIRARCLARDSVARKAGAWALLAIALPALTAVPFVVEVRFFIPMIVAAHAIAIFGWREAVPQLKQGKPMLGLLLFVSACMALSLSVSSRAGLHFFESAQFG